MTERKARAKAKAKAADSWESAAFLLLWLG
jgi:hypothetical protein